jgi:hypothetical protein
VTDNIERDLEGKSVKIWFGLMWLRIGINSGTL